MTNSDHVAWVKSQRDPALWHEAAIAVLAYCHDDHGFLPWLLEQPDMDRATAGWLLFWPEGSLYLSGETSHFDFLDNSNEAEMVAMLHSLCARSETKGFARDELGLDQGFEAERQRCLDIVAQDEVANGLTVPHRIISQGFVKPTTVKYAAQDGGIIFVT